MPDPRAALAWIVGALNRCQIPFQITGGLAARAYGSQRALADIDIDIPEEAFARLVPEVRPYVRFGPARYQDESWDLLLMTLDYQHQAIDLGGAYQAKIFDRAQNEWVPLRADFATAEVKTLWGIPVPVVCRRDLLSYKRRLGREVDQLDIADIERAAGLEA